MRIKFTAEQDMFIANAASRCETTYDMANAFNAKFPEHQTTCSNLRHRMALIGVKKGTHNIRKSKINHGNVMGTIITDKRGRTRIKTENGYVSANKYYVENIFGESYKSHIIIHLNGNTSDFTKSNIMCIPREIYAGLCWRGWIFSDPEITKTAILVQKLLNYFPELTHNENQWYGIRKES